MSNQLNEMYPSGGDIGNGRIVVPRIDPISGATVGISVEHYRIHVGEHFYVNDFVELDDGQTSTLSFTTPETSTWVHMFWSIASNGPSTIQLYEGATGISGGSAVTGLNSNRNSDTTANLTGLLNPTIVDDGVLITQSKFGVSGTMFASPTGGSSQRDSEIILRQDTSYVFRITANADDVIVSYYADWYELVSEN